MFLLLEAVHLFLEIWHLVFGIGNLVLRFGIDCWNPEFGLRFSELSGVFMSLQYYLPFIAQGGY